jgi:hypothetical protein
MFEHIHGPVPEGVEVCHRCDVRNCVNPDHLFLGSHTANMQDAQLKGRTSRGEGRPLSQLAEDDVREIRRRAAAGESCYRIAKDYPVSNSQIENVVARRQWRHIA